MHATRSPHTTPSVRVLVVGDAGCGKSTLCSFLATRSDDAPAARTQGADVHVRLVHSHGSPSPCFVELWECSGDDETYGALLPVVMQAAPVAAVLLCHDLSQPRGTGTASLSRWAALCGTHATWACSPAQSQGATTPLAARLRELGVSAPAMVLGLKEDAVPTTGVHGHTSLASLLLSLILLPVHRAVSMARGAVARLRGVGSSSRRAGIDDSDSPHQHRLPEFMTREQRDAALFSEGTSLCCSPGYGRVDVDVLDAFFKHVIMQCTSLAADGVLLPPLSSHRHKRSWSGASSGGGGSFDFGVVSPPAGLSTPVALRSNAAARGMSMLRSGSQSFGESQSPVERDIEADGRLAWAEDQLQQRSPRPERTW